MTEAGGGDQHRDEPPADLDAAGYVGPGHFPDNSRRRIPGALYLGIARLCVVIWAVWRDDLPYVNDGWLWQPGVTVAAAISIPSSWRMHVNETEAFVAAQQAVGFPVGHASPTGVAWTAQPPDVAGPVLLGGGPASSARARSCRRRRRPGRRAARRDEYRAVGRRLTAGVSHQWPLTVPEARTERSTRRAP